MRALYKTCFVALFLSLATLAAAAQQRVHAASGVVTAIRPKIRMIELDMDDGTSGHFKWLSKSDPPIEFDKSVSTDAVAADQFATLKVHVILYYVGEGDVRTAVAVRALGDAPLNTANGTVVKLNRHDRQLTIKTSTGTEESFRLDPKTVGDTENGVAQGLKFDFNKGNPVRVTFTASDGGETALLIAPVL